jgi:hypothetical protein
VQLRIQQIRFFCLKRYAPATTTPARAQMAWKPGSLGVPTGTGTCDAAGLADAAGAVEVVGGDIVAVGGVTDGESSGDLVGSGVMEMVMLGKGLGVVAPLSLTTSSSATT